MTEDEVYALPVVVDLPTAARALGLGRSAAYELVRAGQWPTPIVRLGRLIKVPRGRPARGARYHSNAARPLTFRRQKYPPSVGPTSARRDVGAGRISRCPSICDRAAAPVHIGGRSVDIGYEMFSGAGGSGAVEWRSQPHAGPTLGAWRCRTRAINAPLAALTAHRSDVASPRNGERASGTVLLVRPRPGEPALFATRRSRGETKFSHRPES